MHRRTFVRNCLFVSAGIALARKPCLFAATPPKRILVLGGTLFLGPAFVETALAGGHTVTLFNRGITNPELFPNVEKLRGFRSADRDDQDLSALERRHWDAVIDVWPHDPVVVESAAQLLKDRAKHYLYVSSIGAYAKENFTKPSLREDASLTKWDSDASFYNRGKAESERRLETILGDKLTVMRPGPIKGVRDDTPDVLVWLKRLQKYSTVAAPGDGKSPVEIVDVKDVAEFLMLAIDRTLVGTFNLTGRPMSFLEFLEECKSATHSDSDVVWIPEPFLREQGLVPAHVKNWLLPFPYWDPDPSMRGFSQVSSQKAYDAGWETRPFRNTALDYLIYVASMKDFVFRDALSAAKHDELLNAWRSRKP